MNFLPFLSDTVMSVSGWRRVFAISGNETDDCAEISAESKVFAFLAARAFLHFVQKKTALQRIIVGRDSRPTGDALCRCVLAALQNRVDVQYLGIVAAPEIMANALDDAAFIYISASHNPIGHNGIKFGLSDGGVLCAEDAAELRKIFDSLCQNENLDKILCDIERAEKSRIDAYFADEKANKAKSLDAYEKFMDSVIFFSAKDDLQAKKIAAMKDFAKKTKIGIVCDFNGSARAKSIDARFFAKFGIDLHALNAGKIAHGIIPEGENLRFCAEKVEELAENGGYGILLGYVPDCDGDRGNIVFYNEARRKAEILPAQTVFALCVFAELSLAETENNAVIVNDATSMRIEELAKRFGAKVFRSEVGEANVINLGKAMQQRGFSVRICGEGSNGGNITFPEHVRDPLNTIFAILRLCAEKNIAPQNAIDELPKWTTTGVDEPCAKMQIKTQNHAELKAAYQKIFEKHWAKNQDFFAANGIVSYRVYSNNGLVETPDLQDFSLSGTGGLKIVFADKNGENIAFIWMRGSKTEPIFRILADVKGENRDLERKLIDLQRKMIVETER